MPHGLLAPLMFGALVAFLLTGYPVAFSLGAVGIVFALIGIELGALTPALLQALPERVFGIMRNDTLLAIPFFIFMGLILERSRMAEELLDTLGQLFGTVRGGLAYSVVLVGALLAATTGVVAASVIAMGLISLPVMLRHGYSPRLASGIIAASGTLAQIIPPSLVLIVLADQLGRSVGDMYRAALIPGVALAGLYALFVLAVSLVNPSAVPALGPDARRPRGRALAARVATVLVPPLALMFFVLGTIFLGIATPTEGGAMGATGALLLALARGRLTLALARQAMDSTLRLTSFVIFILVGATVFGLIFRAIDGDLWVERLLAELPGGASGFLIVVNALTFVLAFFLDFFEIAFILVPLIAPVAAKLGIDLVWLGVVLGVNMQTSFLHPPFGFALHYLRGVAPRGMRTSDIYWGAVPFLAIQLAMVALIIAFPQMVLHYRSAAPGRDPATIQIELPPPEAPGAAGDKASGPEPDPSAAEIERALRQAR